MKQISCCGSTNIGVPIQNLVSRTAGGHPRFVQPRWKTFFLHSPESTCYNFSFASAWHENVYLVSRKVMCAVGLLC